LKSIILFILASCSTYQRVEKPVEVKPIVTESVQGEIIEVKANSSLNYIQEVAKGVNCVIRKQSFIDEVSKIEKFEATSDNGIEVLKKLHSKSCTITTYQN
jgi:hypothetical protein